MDMGWNLICTRKTALNEAVELVVSPNFYSKTASYSILVTFCNSLYYIELANLNPLSSHEKILRKFIKTDFSDSLNRPVYASPPTAARKQPERYAKQEPQNLLTIIKRNDKIFFRKTILIIFLVNTVSLSADSVAYSGKKNIEMNTKNYIIIHKHDWSIAIQNYSSIDPFSDRNTYSYIECINKITKEVVFHAPCPALTYISISDDEKYVVGISNIMIDNPYQLSLFQNP
jgi:hypothetical protein